MKTKMKPITHITEYNSTLYISPYPLTRAEILANNVGSSCSVIPFTGENIIEERDAKHALIEYYQETQNVSYKKLSR